jgi:hypothetical protein
MASYELSGKLKVVMETQTFGSGFTKREFVVTTEEQYPQEIKFELIKEKTSAVDSYRPGDRVKVSFNLRGNEYNGKYFTNLQAWRIEADNSIGSVPPPLDPMAAMPRAAAPATPLEDIGEDDLPF